MMQNQSPPHILFFDVNDTLLDLSPLQDAVEQALGGNEALAKHWFPELLQKAMVLSLTDSYRNFDEVAKACLFSLASEHDIALSQDQAQQTLKKMQRLAPYPEVPEALERLKNAGYTLIPLTNSSASVLDEQIKHAGLDQSFEQWFSVESIGLFKPHRHVYRWACQQVACLPGECMMIAAHDWDIAGALGAGMRGIFIGRNDKSYFPFTQRPEYEAADLLQAANYLVQLKD